MKLISVKDAKNGFGCLVDTVRAEPVAVENVVVLLLVFY